MRIRASGAPPSPGDASRELHTFVSRNCLKALARSTLSKFYAWAIGEGLCDHNPVIGTNKRDENDPRERSLSDAEVARVWLTAPDSDYGSIVKLILLTGCRRTELGDLKWSEFDTEARTVTLPRDRTKNHQEHIVP